MEIPNTSSFVSAQPMNSGDVKKRVDIADSYSTNIDYLKFSVPSMVIGAGHDLANGTFWDVDPEDVKQDLDSMGMDNLATFYGKHEAGARLTGTLATSLIPITLSTKLARVGGMLESAVAKMGPVGEKAASLLFSTGLTVGERITQMQKSDAFAQLVANRVSSTEIIKAQLQKARLSAGMDMFKESIAAEAVLYGLYYDERTAKEGTNPFYTDSTLQNVLFAAVPTAVFAGGSYAMTGRKMGDWIAQHEASGIADAINTHGVKVVDAFQRPGDRGVYLASQAQIVAREKEFANTVTNANAATESANRLDTANNAIVDSFGEMAKDKYFGPAITPFRKPESVFEEAKLASKFISEEPSAGVGIVGIDSFTHETQNALKKVVPAELNRLNKKITELDEVISAAPGEMAAQFQKEKLGFQKQLFELQNSSRFVLETDGSLSKLEQRVFTPLDDLPNFKTVEDKGWTLDPTKTIGVSPNGKWSQFLTEAKKAEIAKQKGAFTILHEGTAYAEPTQQLLDDMASHWGYRTNGSFGKAVYDELPIDAQDALDAWKGSSRGSTLRKWHTDAPEKIQQIQDAFRGAGFHKRLTELADSDGYITVYRGELKNPRVEDLVSVSTNAKFANDAFGSGSPGVLISDRNTLKMRVHVNDVIAPMEADAGMREFEFIIRGNSSRVDVANELARKRGMGTMSHDEMMTGWAITQKQLLAKEAVLDAKATGKPTIDGRASFPEIDYHVEMLRKADATGGHYDVRSLLGEGDEFIGTHAELISHLEFESLVRKFDFYQEQVLTRLAKEKMHIKTRNPLTDVQIAQAANLPFDYAFGKHPVLQVFDSHLPLVGGARRSLSSFYHNMDELKDAMRGMMSPGALSETKQSITDISLRGNSLRWDKDVKAKPAILHYSGNRLQNRIGPDLLNQMIQAEKISMLDRLVNLEGANAPLVKMLANDILSVPEAYSMMSKPELLVAGSERSHSKITTQAFGNQGVPTLVAADDVMGTVKRKFDKVVSKQFEEHNAVFAKLVSTNNSGSLASFGIARNALRRGWDVTEAIAENGKHVLKLDPASARNAKLWEQSFGGKFDDVADDMMFLPTRDGNGNPIRVVLDDVAMDGLRSVQKLSHSYLDNINPLRIERGLKPITKRPFHIPFFNMQNTNQAFILNTAGGIENVISGATAKSALETAQKNLDEMVKTRGFRGTIKTPDQLQENFQAAHLEWEPPTNFGLSSKQTGGIKGRAATDVVEVDPDMVRGIVRQLQVNHDSIFRYTTSTMFESELEFAQRAKMASSIDAGTKAKAETIWDNYQRAILQKAALNKNSSLGAAYSGLEVGMDRMLAGLWDNYAKFVPSSKKLDEKTYAGLQNATGGEQPFLDLADMISRTQHVNVPPSSKQVFERFNRLATNVTLRILDAGMAVVNYASLLATVPAVMKAMRRMPDESIEGWRARTGAYGLEVGEDFVMPNPSRLAMMAAHEVWQPEFQAAMKKAAAKGMFDQEAAERIAFLTAPFETTSEAARRKIIDRLSIATDWSEKMSRAMSYGMGFSIAKRAMGLSDDAAMLFAHKMANSVIGDYRTVNKPQIFQGAVGMPFGLFTTWSWNLLQRVYGDMEGGRLGAVAMQAVLQQLYFGAESLPGAEIFFGPLTSSYDGKTNIVDRLDEAYGKDVANFLISGGLSSLTGMAVQSRADITTPALFSGAPLSQKIPAVGILAQWGQGVNDIYSSFKSNGGYNHTQVMEAVSLYAVNGAAKNAAQLGLGYSVDKSHNLVTPDTRTAPNVIARLIELRTQAEHRKMLELKRDKIAQGMYNDRVAGLKDALQAKLRSGNLTDEDLGGILENYVRAGGTTAGMKQLIRGAVMDGFVDQHMQLLIEKVKKNNDENGVARLMFEYGEGME